MHRLKFFFLGCLLISLGSCKPPKAAFYMNLTVYHYSGGIGNIVIGNSPIYVIENEEDLASVVNVLQKTINDLEPYRQEFKSIEPEMKNDKVAP